MICQRNNPGRARSANGAGEALHRADEALHRSLRIDDVLPSFCAVAAEILGADKTSVVVWDARRERLVVRAMHGFDSDLWRLSLAPGEGLAGPLAQARPPAVVEDRSTDP